MIAIRADANETIAMGHIMRCLSVAKQLQKYGESIVFISSDDRIRDKIIGAGFEFYCLHNDYKKKDSEVEELLKFLKDKKIDTLLLDSYQATESYMKCLNEKVRLIYIDDLNAFRYPADAIVNYTAHAAMDMYLERGYEEDVQFLLGSEYIPLREEFSQNRIEIKDKVEGIFITTGGTDSYDMILELLNQMNTEDYNHVKKYIVVGKFYNSYDILKKMEKASEGNLIVYQNIDNIYDVMKQCDVAISAGGTTVSELCAMGLPTIAFTMADNQLNGTRAYDEDGIIIYAGDIREEKEKVVFNIDTCLRELMHGKDKRCALSKRALEKIDGMGAKRIAQLICTAD